MRDGVEAVSPRQLLFTYLGPEWARVAALGVLLVATIGLRLAGPQLLRLFIDGATTGAALERLIQLAIVFLTAALLLQVATLAEVWVAENVALIATNHLRADLVEHVLRLDPPFFATHTPGELIERTDGDVAKLGNFFSRMVVHVLGNILLLVGILALLAGIDARIGAAATACAIVAALLMTRLRRLAVPRFEQQRQASAELFGLIEERLAGTEDVRANGGVSYVLRRLLERSRELVWAHVRARIVGTATFQSAFLSLQLATAITLSIAAWLYWKEGISIGTVYLVFAYTVSLDQPLHGLMRQIEDLQQAAASIGRVRRLLAERSTLVDGHGPPLSAGPLAVEVDGVTFAYEDG
jgi:ATP-binding cassette subfamily B protein